MQSLVEAKKFAEFKHKNQRYDWHEYIFHLEQVVQILEDFGYEEEYLICGYLHDIIEDQGVKCKEIKAHFGEWVAEIVYCCTDELGRTRKEKKEKTYPKQKNNKDAIIIKLADRIANGRYSKKTDSKHFQVYVGEYPEFKKQLFEDVEYIYSEDSKMVAMWEELDSLFL